MKQCPVMDNLLSFSLLLISNSGYYNNNNLYNNPYGKLYNFFAVTDPRNLCPDGFYIPDNEGWTTLINYLGGTEMAGGKMKEISLAYWDIPNTNATNSSGFKGIPTGTRHRNGSFSFSGNQGYWWSDSEEYEGAWGLNLGYGNTNASMYIFSRNDGKSVRCMKQLSVPDITTADVNEFDATSATIEGNISNDGGATVLQRGFCWDVVANPTIENFKVACGNGTGSFTTVLSGLIPNTTYYARGYAINDPGIAYGNKVSFTTALFIPGNGVTDVDGN